MLQCGRQSQGEVKAFAERQPAAAVQIEFQGVRDVQIRIPKADIRRKFEVRSPNWLARYF